jgi:predicted amidophosphoribosyltransferase
MHPDGNKSMEIFILLWVVCGFFAAVVASNRGASGCLWFGLGVLLGPIGLAISFVAGDTKTCSRCRSDIPQKATRCPKCQADLEKPPADDGETQALVTALKTGRPLSEIRPKAFRCPKCQTPITPDQASCAGCGAIADWAGSGATKKCPDCAEEVKADARKCRFCGYRFDHSTP